MLQMLPQEENYRDRVQFIHGPNRLLSVVAHGSQISVLLQPTHCTLVTFPELVKALSEDTAAGSGSQTDNIWSLWENGSF